MLKAKQITFFFEGIHEHFLPPLMPIPDDWLVFNAARYLSASNLPDSDNQAMWTGDFHCGVYYAAVDPSSPRAEQSIQRNNDLDAYLCRWITKDHVYDWIATTYINEYGKQRIKQLLGNLETTWDEFFEEHYTSHCQKYSDWAKEFYREFVLLGDD